MHDPLSEVIALLQPRTVFAKRISGAGRWGVRYSKFGQPSFCVVLEGSCRLAVDGERVVTIEAGDFVLLSDLRAFQALTSVAMVTNSRIPRLEMEGRASAPGMELRYTSDEAVEHPYLSGKPFTLSWRKRQTKNRGTK